MTTAPAQPFRDRPALGRGVSTLIPQSAAVSPAERASAALAAIQTVPVHLGLLEAAAVLLEEAGRTSEDEATRAAVVTTVAMLRTAMDHGGRRPSTDG